MVDMIEDLMRANLLDVFNERDETKRRAAIDRTYAPEVALDRRRGCEHWSRSA